MTSLVSNERTLEQYIIDLLKSKQLTGNKFLELCALPKLKKHCFNMMRDGGADIFAVDENNQNALFKAAESGNLILLRTLLALGVDFRHRDNFGEIPLSVALRCGNRSVAECLLEITDNPATVIDNEGSSLLHKAAWGNLPESAELLLDQYNMDINIKDYAGRTALHVAAYQGNTKVLKYLLERSTDVNVIDNEGKTPIFSGAYDGNMKTVKMLCEYGANLLLRDNNDLTVLEYAIRRKEFETAKFLNGKSGNIYPKLENAIKRHKAEQSLRIRQAIEEMKQMSVKNDLSLP